LNEFFPALPDARAIARLSGEQRERRGVPLFLDGLRVLAGDEPLAERLQWLPFPKEQLDYTGPWTAWRGLFDRA
jgi:hypothetical protein